MNDKELQKQFIHDCGYFGINPEKIIKIEKHPEYDYSLFIYCDESNIPCFCLKYRTSMYMDLSYMSLIAGKKKEGFNVIDFGKYKKK